MSHEQVTRSEDTAAKSPLVYAVENEILVNGPISFDRFMGAALYGLDTSLGFIPGYYSEEVSIGKKDKEDKFDFSTSPELSPVFGFCLAEQIIEMKKILGNPADFKIVEMGGGRGTLAYDIIHGIRYAGEELPEYVIIESSSTLQAQQREKLKDENVSFLAGSAIDFELPQTTGVFISNELPDAFPVKMVSLRDGQVKELFIGLGDNEKFEEVWQDPSEDVLDFIKRNKVEIDEKTKPLNLLSEKWIQNVARQIRRGFVITIDYETGTFTTTTLHIDGQIEFVTRSTKEDLDLVFMAKGRALNGFSGEEGKEHLCKKYFGKVDLTSSVDFSVIARAGKTAGLRIVGDVTQGGFLEGLGFHSLKELHYETYREREARVIFGDRGNFKGTLRALDNAEELLDRDRVLIQAKNVELTNPLSGGEHVYHDRLHSSYQTFRPIEITEEEAN